MPKQLPHLSDELLAHMCSYAMTWPATTKPESGPALHHPDGVISEQISKRFRQLLQPFRCCHRLYHIARHEFLEANVIVLSLGDIRGSASRLEFTSGKTQMIMTGNPDPLLRSLVHLELVVSISDMRAPFSRPYASVESGGMAKSGGNMLSMTKEAENLKHLTVLCPNLRTVHLFLKVDEWMLYGRGPNLRKTESATWGEAGLRYRQHAEAMVDLVKEVPLKTVTVAFCHWRGDAEVLQMGGRGAGDVVDVCLMPTVRENWNGPIARVR